MRHLLAPRLLGVHALAIVGIAICLFLSSWQWNRAHTPAPTTSADGIAKFDSLSPLRSYLPVSSIGVPTRVTGHWQQPGAGQLGKSSRIILPNRPADGSVLSSKSVATSDTWLGAWIVDLLVLDDGSTVAVVRGWAKNPASIPVASGKATVFGVMQPSEDSGLSALPSIQLLTTATITEQATSAVHDGYLVAQLGPRESTLGTASSSNTSADQTLVQVTPIIKGELKPPLHWRNVVYTANWIVFALIVVYMWIRIVRDDLGLAQDADDADRDGPEPESADLAQSKTD